MNNSEYPVGRWLLGKPPYKFDPSSGEGSTVTCLEESNVNVPLECLMLILITVQSRLVEDDIILLSVCKGCFKTTCFQQSDNQAKHCKTFIMEGQHIFFHSGCKSKPRTAVLLKTTHWYLSRLTKLTVKILCYVEANNLLATRRQGKDLVN